MLRGKLGDRGGPDEDGAPVDPQPEPEELSYFRLFQAIESYRERLRKVESRDVLERWLFSQPGCIQELAAKSRQRIAEDPSTVFNWFLAQEVNSLSPLALEQLERFREKYERRTVPERWAVLVISEPKLPQGLASHKAYLRKVRMEAGYAK